MCYLEGGRLVYVNIHKIGLKSGGHLLVIPNQHDDVLKFSNIKTTAMMMLEFDRKIK